LVEYFVSKGAYSSNIHEFVGTDKELAKAVLMRCIPSAFTGFVKHSSDRAAYLRSFMPVLKDHVVMSCVIKAGKGNPIMDTLMWREAFQKCSGPIDEWSDDLADLISKLDRVAMQLLSESGYNTLKDLAQEERFSDLICRTQALATASSPRLKTVEDWVWGWDRGLLWSLKGIFHAFQNSKSELPIPAGGLPWLRFASFYFWQMMHLLLVVAMTSKLLPSHLLHGQGWCWWDAMFGTWTVAIFANEASQAYRLVQQGQAYTYVQDKWNCVDILVLLFLAISIGCGAASAHDSAHSWAVLALLLMCIRILHPVSILSQEFGLIINTVFAMIGVLTRYVAFIVVLMVTFGLCFGLIKGFDDFEGIVLKEQHGNQSVSVWLRNQSVSVTVDASESSLPKNGSQSDMLEEQHGLQSDIARFVYATFLLTFEGQGAKELMNAAFTDGQLCFFILAFFFRMVVVLMAMNLIIGVMSGEWTKHEPLAKAVHALESLQAAKQFRWSHPEGLLPPPLNLISIPLLGLCEALGLDQAREDSSMFLFLSALFGTYTFSFKGWICRNPMLLAYLLFGVALAKMAQPLLLFGTLQGRLSPSFQLTCWVLVLLDVVLSFWIARFPRSSSDGEGGNHDEEIRKMNRLVDEFFKEESTRISTSMLSLIEKVDRLHDDGNKPLIEKVVRLHDDVNKLQAALHHSTSASS